MLLPPTQLDLRKLREGKPYLGFKMAPDRSYLDQAVRHPSLTDKLVQVE